MIQSLEICYTFRVWVRSGRCGFILWECHTCPLFGGGMHLRFTIFLYLKECVVILKFGSTVSYGLTRETRLRKCKAIAYHTHLLDCMKCSTFDSDPFTRWSFSGENEVLYGRIVVCLSQERRGYSTKCIIYIKLLNYLCGRVSIPPP